MKTSVTLIAFLVFTFNSFAQYQWTPFTNYRTNYEWESEQQFWRDSISKNKIKSIVTKSTYIKGQTYKSAINYSTDGYLDSFVWFDKELPVKKEYRYNEFSKINQVKNYDKKGNVVWESNFVFNSDTLVTEYLHHRKEKEYSKRLIGYDDKKIISSDYYKKGSEEAATTYTYSYYDNGSQKETNHYKKGKLQYTWNYDCKSEGEVVQKHKDTTQVCIWDEFDSKGRFVKWMQTTNEKNKIRKTKRVFEKEGDKRAVAYYSYNMDDVLTYSWERSKEKYINSNYNKKGELTNTYQVNYNNIGKEIKTISTRYVRGKKRIYSSEIFYNENGWKESAIATNYKGKTTKTEYSYEYY